LTELGLTNYTFQYFPNTFCIASSCVMFEEFGEDNHGLVAYSRPELAVLLPVPPGPLETLRPGEGGPGPAGGGQVHSAQQERPEQEE